MLYLIAKIKWLLIYISCIAYDINNPIILQASSIDELRLPSRAPKDSDIPEHLLCPICMDLLHRAVCCQPCNHIFCDRCLRKLAKYSSKAHSTCICPICRTVISYCNKMFGKCGFVYSLFSHT